MKESERTQKEKSYEDEQDFRLFIDGSSFPDTPEGDDEFFACEDKIVDAFKLLVEAKVITSRSQFAGALATMQKLLVPLKEAAAICQVSQQSFRRLEKRGVLKITRMKHDTRGVCFIQHTDIIKYLTARLKK